jgi:hypothetical protein
MVDPAAPKKSASNNRRTGTTCRRTSTHVIHAVIAAHAGFCVGGSLWQPEPGLAPIVAVKAELSSAATAWLQRRLAHCQTAQ